MTVGESESIDRQPATRYASCYAYIVSATITTVNSDTTLYVVNEQSCSHASCGNQSTSIFCCLYECPRSVSCIHRVLGVISNCPLLSVSRLCPACCPLSCSYSSASSSPNRSNSAAKFWFRNIANDYCLHVAGWCCWYPGTMV